jgi:hypothetical protein
MECDGDNTSNRKSAEVVLSFAPGSPIRSIFTPGFTSLMTKWVATPIPLRDLIGSSLDNQSLRLCLPIFSTGGERFAITLDTSIIYGAYQPKCSKCSSYTATEPGGMKAIIKCRDLTLLSWCKSCGSIYIHPHDNTEEGYRAVIVPHHPGTNLYRITWPPLALEARRTKSISPAGVTGSLVEVAGIPPLQSQEHYPTPEPHSNTKRGRQHSDQFTPTVTTGGVEGVGQGATRKRRKP